MMSNTSSDNVRNLETLQDVIEATAVAVVRRKVLSDAGGEGRCRCKSSRDQIHFAQIDDEPLMAVLVGFAPGFSGWWVHGRR
jgi:hypothetical protein